jgi:hypothetical protein
MAGRTIEDALTDARTAYDGLAMLGEDVEDEWTYVTELASAWRDRLDAVIGDRGGEPVPSAADEAISTAIAEIGLIRDPHRAIDWLSTFPQVVLVAVGERP